MAIPQITVDTPTLERVAWLEIEIARMEGRLATARAALASEKLIPDLGVEEGALLHAIDTQLGENLAAELTARRLALKRRLPHAAGVIDAVFDEDDDEPSEPVRRIAQYPERIAQWFVDVIDCYVGFRDRLHGFQGLELADVIHGFITQATPDVARALREMHEQQWAGRYPQSSE